MAERKAAPVAKAPRALSPTHHLDLEVREAAARGFRYYVYTLADAQGVFYVGKGQGARLLQHGAKHDRCNPAKQARIAEAGDSLIRTIVAVFGAESDALQCEREWIADMRDGLTNITSGGTHQDPRQRAMATAQAMLARVIPRHLYRKPARVRMSDDEALATYDRVVALLQKEAVDPTPNLLTIDSNGRAAWGFA